VNKEETMSAISCRPKNWLLHRLRSWHARIGMVALLLLMMLALTGVYLNHTALFRLDSAPEEAGEPLTTMTLLSSTLAPVSRALQRARAEWGDVPLQFVQLRQEGGRLLYRVRRKGRSDEVTVDARTGRLVAVRDQWQETVYGEDGAPQASHVSWTRVFYDLHTGRILGEPGKLIADAAGVALLLLAGSGVYLFTIPRWRKWRTARRRTSVRILGVSPNGVVENVR
jgi:hypothetical protein